MYKKLAQNSFILKRIFKIIEIIYNSLINRNINTRIIVARYLIAIFPRVKLKSLPLLLSLFLLFLIGREILSVPSPRRKRFHGCLYFFQHYVHVVGLPVDLSSETIYGGSSVKLISKQVKVVDRTCGHPENGVS